MDDLEQKFPLGTKVKTPSGSGLVVGYIHRNETDQVIVSLDFLPMAIMDRGENPVVVYSFPGDTLKKIYLFKRFDLDFQFRKHEVINGHTK